MRLQCDKQEVSAPDRWFRYAASHDAEDFMVVCLRRAAQQQANARLAESVKTDFIRILLVGRGGDEYPLVYC